MPQMVFSHGKLTLWMCLWHIIFYFRKGFETYDWNFLIWQTYVSNYLPEAFKGMHVVFQMFMKPLLV